MCKTGKQLKFCTCEHIENVSHETCIWILDRYIGAKESRLLGKIKRPDDHIGEIQKAQVIEAMNQGNCFDFNYEPQEADTLCIKNEAKNHNEYKYFSLKYVDGKWIEGMNDPFGRSITENISKGTLKLI